MEAHCNSRVNHGSTENVSMKPLLSPALIAGNVNTNVDVLKRGYTRCKNH
ncbi:hypothetical protein RR46_02516 [Papilio xuthus]|uniref:Uncharacterized protein n=1 Tax=Papilio xuthus TaxID=66420 RepID=A0A194QHC3_PAPXU|nr:hypothetical protein RR46_02516 [Papilio xuthus]